MIDVSLVLPCFNESPHIEESVREISRVLNAFPWTWEIIFVDDKSEDNTREKIAIICDNDPAKMRAIFHEKNTGRGGAVIDGFRAARGRVVGFLDIDLEIHARYLPILLSPLLRGEKDLCVGRRVYRLELLPTFLVRHFLSVGYRLLVAAFLRMPFSDTESGCKFFVRDKVLPLLEFTQNRGWFWDTEIMYYSYHAGLRVEEIPCLLLKRFGKASTVNLFVDPIAYFAHLWRFAWKVSIFAKYKVSLVRRE